MSYIKTYKFWVALVILFYTLFGFIFIPWFLSNKTAPLLQEKIGLHVEIGKAKFNPFTFKLIVENILLKDLDKKPVLGFKKVYIDYDILGLFDKTILFKTLDIDSPKLYARLEKTGKLNLENILPPSPVKNKTEKKDSSSLPIIILQKLNITNGNLSFSDLRNDEPFNLKLGPYSFKAHDISTRKGDLNAHSFRTKIGKDGEIFWEGGMRLNPMSLYGEVKITNLKLPKLYSYAVPNLNVKLKRGTLFLQLPYQVNFAKKVQTSINSANLTLSNILFEDKNSLIDISKIEINGFYLEWPKQNIVIEKFSINDSRISTVLDEKKSLNIIDFFQKSLNIFQFQLKIINTSN